MWTAFRRKILNVAIDRIKKTSKGRVDAPNSESTKRTRQEIVANVIDSSDNTGLISWNKFGHHDRSSRNGDTAAESGNLLSCW
jgi:hypothetical protein